MLGYATNEHGYRVFNKTTSLIEIVVDVTFDETDGSQKEQVNVEIVGKEEAPHQAIKKLAIGEIKPVEDEDEDHVVHVDHDPTIHHVPSNGHGEASITRNIQVGKSNDAQVHSHQDGANNVQAQSQLNNEERSEDNPPQAHDCDPPFDHNHDDEDDGPIQRSTQVPHPRVHPSIQWDHPVDNILGSIRRGVTTHSRLANFCEHDSFVSPLEPSKVEGTLDDKDWMIAMQEELSNFTWNEVWSLVERPKQNVIGTKWVFRNKQDEHGMVTRNKTRSVAQGFTQIEGLDFGETYAPVARLESIRILLAYAAHHDFKLYQMDMKSAFFNSPLSKLVYVEQPPGFEDPKYPNHVYKLDKTLYGLKQAPRAWYDCLKDFLLKQGFEIGKVDLTLFTHKVNNDVFVCQIYVDDIIFGSINVAFCELKFFLGFQIKQLKGGTFISQNKYTKDMLKKFDMDKAKPIKTPMPTNGHLDLDQGGKDVNQKVYRSMIESLLYLCASRPGYYV
jgi:hypothetical protein